MQRQTIKSVYPLILQAALIFYDNFCQYLGTFQERQ